MFSAIRTGHRHPYTRYGARLAPAVLHVRGLLIAGAALAALAHAQTVKSTLRRVASQDPVQIAWGGGVVPPRAPVRGQGTARRRAGQDLVRAPQQALAEEDRTPPSAEQRRRPSHSHRLARRSARREAEVPRNATPALQVSRVERRRNLCPRGAADGPGGRTRASGGHQPIDPARSTREGVAQGTEAPDAGVGARRAPEAVAAAVGPRRETQVHPVAHLNPCPLRPAPV